MCRQLGLHLGGEGGDLRRAMGEAWQAGGEGLAVETILERLAGAGVRRFAVTAIERDGMLVGPDLALLRRARARLAGAELIASGGVATLDDLAALADLGCDGVIVGRALYEGRFTLPDAIAAAGGNRARKSPRVSGGFDRGAAGRLRRAS